MQSYALVGRVAILGRIPHHEHHPARALATPAGASGNARRTFRRWVWALAGLVSRSEMLTVAVGLSPRVCSVKWVRRGATIESASGFQTSLRDAPEP